MRGEQRRDRAVARRDHRHRLDVARIRQAEPTVLGGNLDPKSAHLAQFLNVFLRNFARAVDHIGVDARQKVFEPIEERLCARGFGRIFRGMRMNEIETKASEEQLTYEAGTRPFTFARGLRYVTCLFFGSKTTGVL